METQRKVRLYCKPETEVLTVSPLMMMAGSLENDNEEPGPGGHQYDQPGDPGGVVEDAKEFNFAFYEKWDTFDVWE